MSVLIEALSVIIKTEAVFRHFPDWEAFVAWVPNRTLCADDQLARIGFMAPIDVHCFIQRLQERGLVFQHAGRCVDLVVIDQLSGPMAACSWIETGHISIPQLPGCPRVAAARLRGDVRSLLMCPEGWTYAGSLSQHHKFVPSGEVEHAFRDIGDPDAEMRTLIDHEGQRWYLAHCRWP